MNNNFRIISSIPDEKFCAYKAQVHVRFLFITWWSDIADWRGSISDCEKDIKSYKGEITNVVKYVD